MRNVIFVHGRPYRWEYFIIKVIGHKNSLRFYWAGWLGRQLRERGYKFDAPEMPRSYDPKYDLWVKKVEQFKIGPETTLVGHSTGAGFWVKYLSLNPGTKVAEVILVAPWLGYDYGAPPTDFFENYQIDPDLAKRTKELVIFYSDNDFEAIKKSIADLKAILKGARFKEFHNYGHFTLTSMKTRKFPELLEKSLAGNT